MYESEHEARVRLEGDIEAKIKTHEEEVVLRLKLENKVYFIDHIYSIMFLNS
jgi:hypothetical protein